MLHLLDAKKTLAAGVIDGTGPAEMGLPSGRQATLERLSDLMDLEPQALSGPASPTRLEVESLAGEVEARHPGSLERMDLVERPDGGKSLFAVVRGQAPEPSDTVRNLARKCGFESEALVVDADTMATIERLVEAGVLSFNSRHRLHGEASDPARAERHKARIKAARADLADAERSLRMARLLADGGFGAEAVEPLSRTVESALSALARSADQPHEAPVELGPFKTDLDSSQQAVIAFVRRGPEVVDQALLEGVTDLLAVMEQRLDQRSLQE